MFNWFRKNNKEVKTKLNIVLNNQNVSAKETFENLVRRTYKQNIKSLFSYSIRCDSLYVNIKAVRVSSSDNIVVFYDEFKEEFYYLAGVNEEDFVKDLVPNRQFKTEVDYSSLIETYISFINSEDDIILAVNNVLKNK